MLEFYIIKILFFGAFAFVFAMLMTPVWTHILYKYKLGKQIRNDGSTPIFSKLHEAKRGTPTMGGVLIWVTVAIFAVVFYCLNKFFPGSVLGDLNFLTRSETLLPLGALVASAVVGFWDDWLDIKGKGVFGGGGLKMRHRLVIYGLIAAVGALWFYFKLDRDQFNIPFIGNFHLGWWYILAFIFVLVATSFSVNETDGLDGLAGGILLINFSSYGVISAVIGKYDLAVFCSVIAGALLAFLWFNIAPARFYMGDTGSMSLGVTLGVIAMLTNTPALLVLTGSIFVLESLSVILQLSSKKLRHGKKIFISSPIHHHFEAIGWPETKIVMRFWVISGVTSAIALIVFMLDRLI